MKSAGLSAWYVVRSIDEQFCTVLQESGQTLGPRSGQMKCSEAVGFVKKRAWVKVDVTVEILLGLCKNSSSEGRYVCDC